MKNDLDAVKREWIGLQFDRAEFAVDAQRLLNWALACGETDPRFIDPDHPDFQGHPTFTACLSTGPALPKGFPQLGNGRGMDGGKSVVVHAPVRPGDILTGRSEIADIYAKTGRSGTMIFIVHRTHYANQRGDLVATVDWRMIRATGN